MALGLCWKAFLLFVSALVSGWLAVGWVAGLGVISYSQSALRGFQLDTH